MTPLLMALTVLAAAALPPPPAPAAPAPPPPAPASPPDPAIAEVSAKVDTMMQAYKGKPFSELVKRLGPSESVRQAADGQVQFWRAHTEGGTVCGMNPATGAFSCNRDWGKQCMLAVAIDTQSQVTAWKLTGEVDACRLFLNPPPPQPPAA